MATSPPPLTRRGFCAAGAGTLLTLSAGADAHTLFRSLQPVIPAGRLNGPLVIMSETFRATRPGQVRAGIMDFGQAVRELNAVIEDLVLSPRQSASPGLYHEITAGGSSRLVAHRDPVNRGYFDKMVGAGYHYNPANPIGTATLFSDRNASLFHQAQPQAYDRVRNAASGSTLQFFGPFGPYRGLSRVGSGFVVSGTTQDRRWLGRQRISLDFAGRPYRILRFGNHHEVSFFRLLGDFVWTAISVATAGTPLAWVTSNEQVRSLYNQTWAYLVEDLLGYSLGDDESTQTTVTEDSTPTTSTFSVNDLDMNFVAYRTPARSGLLYATDTFDFNSAGLPIVKPAGDHNPGAWNLVGSDFGGEQGYRYVVQAN